MAKIKLNKLRLQCDECGLIVDVENDFTDRIECPICSERKRKNILENMKKARAKYMQILEQKKLMLA